MDDDMQERLNMICSQIRIINTLVRAVETCMFGVDELDENDAGCIFSLLREKSCKLQHDYNEIIEDLHI